MTAAKHLPSVVEVPAHAVHIACPLDVCPAASRLIGAVWHQTADAGLAWHTSSKHQPGREGREDSPYQAGLNVITAHIVAAHAGRLGDTPLWLAVGHAAQAVKRTALGLVAPPEPVTGECFWCGGRVDRDHAGRWVDSRGDDVCLASARICEMLCSPHWEGPDVTRCAECDGHGEAYGPHEPICGPMAVWS